MIISERQLEALRLRARGRGNKQIASDLGISPEALRRRLNRACEALSANDVTHAVVIAIGLGLIDCKNEKGGSGDGGT